MPHFTLQFQAGGPQINLLVAVSSPREQALQQANLPVPQPVSVRALIDTGASISAIDSDIVQSLGLQPTGTTLIHTPSTGATPHQTSTYDVRIVIFGFVAAHSFTLPAVAVTESALKAFGFQVLIGRDILSHCLFVYDGRANIFSLAF